MLKSEELVNKLRPFIRLPPEQFVRNAAGLLLVEETKNVLLGNPELEKKGLINVLGEEGVEIMCNRVNEVVEGCKFFTNLEVKDPQQLRSPVDQPRRLSGSIDRDETIDSDETRRASDFDETLVASAKLFSSNDQVESKREMIDDIEYGVSDIAFKQNVEPDRVSPNEVAYFKKFISEVDRNPRRLKRIVNTYQLVAEVAKHRAVAEDRPEELVYKDERWSPFTSKIIKWICLCECYPYRMSLLVLIIEVRANILMCVLKSIKLRSCLLSPRCIMEGFKQKAAMNDIVAKRLEKQSEFVHPSSSPPSEFVRWHDQNDNEDENCRSITKPLSKDALTTTVYFRYIEGFVYAHKLSDKMLRLNSDAEQFAKLLMIPCGDDGSDDITVGDILGQRSPSDLGTSDEREGNFALISYSFNLNVAIDRFGTEFQRQRRGCRV